MKYKEESLGRAAVFLLPSVKLEKQDSDGVPAKEKVEKFLIEKYGGFTLQSGSISGRWKDKTGTLFYDEHRLYEVAFLGKDRIPELKAFLAELAVMLDEQCIRLSTGEDVMLVFPDLARQNDKALPEK